MVSEASGKEGAEEFLLQLDLALLDDRAIIKGCLPIGYMLSDCEECWRFTQQIEMFSNFAEVFCSKDFSVLHGAKIDFWD